MKLTRTQKAIIKAMHRIRTPTTVNEIATTSQVSWITVKDNLKILKKYGLVNYKRRKTKKTSRNYWYINYSMFG